MGIRSEELCLAWWFEQTNVVQLLCLFLGVLLEASWLKYQNLRYWQCKSKQCYVVMGIITIIILILPSHDSVVLIEWAPLKISFVSFKQLRSLRVEKQNALPLPPSLLDVFLLECPNPHRICHFLITHSQLTEAFVNATPCQHLLAKEILKKERTMRIENK
jgi:D-alanyl-lipoteichoic acid acyltransferase DltB (MBOAT superfamily)